MWNSYQEILLCVSMCNLLSILLESYDFAGGLILVLVFSLLILIYEYVFGSGSDYILAQSVSQAVLSDSFDLYTKELASLLNAKSTSPR